MSPVVWPSSDAPPAAAAGCRRITSPFLTPNRREIEMFSSKKAAVLFVLTGCLLPVFSYANDDAHERDADRDRVQVGPRPFYLVDKMSPGPLKRKLEQCGEGPFHKTAFSIGH